MGNTLIPYPRFTMDTWTEQKKYIICKTLSLSACVIGTGIYLSPLEPYLEVPWFGILVPTFITGYMLVHSSDIFQLLMMQDYIFLEIWFSVIGALGSLACGIYQSQKWILWIMDTSHEPDTDYNVAELTLAIVLLLQFGSMSAVVYYRWMEDSQPVN